MPIKINIDGHEVSGEPTEIAQLLEALKSTSKVESSNASPDSHQASEAMTKKFAARVLSRRPLSPAQRKLFQILRNRPEGWTLSSEIMQKMDLNGNQFGGLFGALGRRVANTMGHKEGVSLFEWRWNEDEEEDECRLHPAALEALREMDT